MKFFKLLSFKNRIITFQNPSKNEWAVKWALVDNTYINIVIVSYSYTIIKKPKESGFLKLANFAVLLISCGQSRA